MSKNSVKYCEFFLTKENFSMQKFLFTRIPFAIWKIKTYIKCIEKSIEKSTYLYIFLLYRSHIFSDSSILSHVTQCILWNFTFSRKFLISIHSWILEVKMREKVEKNRIKSIGQWKEISAYRLVTAFRIFHRAFFFFFLFLTFGVK